MKMELQFYDLQRRFDGRELFHIPELVLRDGECTLLSGANGSGKTTLLKMLAGLDPVPAANIYYNRYQLSPANARHFFQNEVVYVHQHAYMLDTSVHNNLAYGLRRRKLARKVIRSRVDEALQVAELEHLARKNGRLLSGGEKQRVALARAWILSPSLLLLDETTANMDQASRQRTYELIRRIKQSGTGLLVCTHDIHPFLPFSDYHLHLKDGILHDMRQAALQDSMDNIISFTRATDTLLHAERQA